ncbi:MAG: ABC transporter permease, partial [Thermus sp.]|nr:ABC transporter permease [Thermus sp.]
SLLKMLPSRPLLLDPDNLIMRLVEIIAAIPTLFLLISLRAVFPTNIDPLFTFYLVVGLLGFIGWGGLARVVRGIVLSVREMDYVQAARALGASDARIIARHVLPATASYIIVSLSLTIPGFILGESGLSFLGLGVTEPYTSWGLLLQAAQQGGFASFVDRPWVLWPGFFIFISIMAWNFVGDGLRDAFDPRRRR